MARVKIPIVSEYKNLGIIFDSKLKFRSQVARVTQMAYYCLRNLYKNQFILNLKLKKQLCESLVLSHCNYCNFVYGPCLDVNSKFKLQKIQNSCIRFIFGLRIRDRVSHKLKELRWLSLKDREKLHLACFLHRLLKSGTPQYLREKLIFRNTLHQRNTRHKGRLQIPKHHTNFFKHSFSYTSIRLLNEIPSNWLDLACVSFKARYRNFLLDNC